MATSSQASARGKQRHRAYFQGRTRSGGESNTNSVRETNGGRSVFGQSVVVLVHTMRFIKQSFTDGLSNHGECHHCFPPHPRRDETSDNT
jgi:hypothetical protein